MHEPLCAFPFGCRRSGLFVLAALGALLLSALSAFLVRGAVLILLFAAFFGILSLVLQLAFGNLQVSFSAGRIRICRGTFFPVSVTCPARAVLAVSAFSTPLLRRLGCPVVLLTLSGRLVLLPAVPYAGYEALCALSGR